MLFQEGAAIQPGGFGGVVGAVLHKAHQARQVHLAVLGGQELLQVIVAQGGVFHVDLPYHAHLHLGYPVNGNGGELCGDLGHGGLDLPAGPALVLHDPAADGVQPLLLQSGRVPLVGLIGLRLGLQGHQQVAVVDAGQELAHQGQGHGEAGVLLQSGEVQAHHRNLAVACLHQGLAQQVDVVGGPAAAASLGDNQGGVV